MRGKVTDIAAALLAGGKNSRMKGENKAFLKINGIPLIERTMGLLEGIFEEVIIVAHSSQDFKSYAKDNIVTEDIIKNAGPLAGIHSALSRTSKGAVFFVACDMPFLHNALIERQLERFNQVSCDCLVPRIGCDLEPLHAVYKRGLRNDISRFFKKGPGYSIREFLQAVNTCYWDLEDSSFNRKAFRNLNTSEDFAKAIAG